jgi:hypothetical protein
MEHLKSEVKPISENENFERKNEKTNLNDIREEINEIPHKKKKEDIQTTEIKHTAQITNHRTNSLPPHSDSIPDSEKCLSQSDKNHPNLPQKNSKANTWPSDSMKKVRFYVKVKDPTKAKQVAEVAEGMGFIISYAPRNAGIFTVVGNPENKGNLEALEEVAQVSAVPSSRPLLSVING